ncbi:hypothetical protein GUJ93_ZPchr0003g18031 [Zizania palustris]|uniref:Uncharacterized protein n=1 Tax=Zizania palustris TaxID=103762 RepID=A0A8J5VX62_ZIZPA|nr:hypothetical protein GUJ93_ZPchr0003g18031 [Zizania palustris]
MTRHREEASGPARREDSAAVRGGGSEECSREARRRGRDGVWRSGGTATQRGWHRGGVEGTPGGREARRRGEDGVAAAQKGRRRQGATTQRGQHREAGRRGNAEGMAARRRVGDDAGRSGGMAARRGRHQEGAMAQRGQR